MPDRSAIWVPCEVFDVVVTADDDRPTELERAAMLFLAWGDNHTLEEVVAFLGLSERLTMDLLIGLWRQGYVLVDTVDGGVRLEDGWKTLVQEGLWEKMESGRSVTETVELMRDLVSGQIAPDRSSPIAPPLNLAAPILIASTISEAVSRVDLAAAAMRHLRRNSPLNARMRKVRAELARPRTGAAARSIGWLRFEFEPELDAEGESTLTLRPVAPGDPALARIGPGIGRALSEWAFSEADHPIVRSLVASARVVSTPPRRSLSARLEGIMDALTAADDGVNAAAIEDLNQSLAAVAGEIDLLEPAGGKVSFLPIENDQPSFLQQATNFEHQLILTSPVVDADGIEALGEALIPVLKARPLDASAMLLWGGRAGTALPARSISFIANMASETSAPQGPRLRAASRSVRISTGLAVLDGRTVLYSSAPPLAAGADPGPFSFVIRVESKKGSEFARTILEMARDRAPDSEMARLIEVRPWDVGHGADQSYAPPTATLDEEAGSSADADDPLTRRTRVRDLLSRGRATALRLERVGSTVAILVDNAVFRCAHEITADFDSDSEEPTLWLGFGPDHHLGRPAAVHRRLADAVADRAAKGLLTVILVNDQQVRNGVDVGFLGTIAASFPDQLKIVSTPGLTGQFVCGEQRLVVAPGGLASPPAPDIKRLSSRLIGVLTADPGVCAAFRKDLVRHWPELARSVGPTSRRKRRISAAAPELSGLVGPLVSAWRLAPGRPRAALAGALEGTDGHSDADKAEALLSLTNGLADHESLALRADLTAILAVRGPAVLRASALQELLRQAWRQGGWQQAALIVEGGGGVDWPVPADLAIAIARIDAGLELAELPAVFEKDDPDAWIAAVALATWAVLFNGDAVAAEALEIELSLDRRPAEAAPLIAIAEAVLAYWSTTGDEVDRKSLAVLARRNRAARTLDVRAKAFATVFRLGINANYNKQMLKRVVPRFYTTTSGLKPVADLIPESGVPPWREILRALDQAFGPQRVDASALADEILEKTHRTYANARDEAIQGGKGLAIREATREVMVRAQDLRDAIRISLSERPDRATEGLTRLVNVLRRESSSLNGLSSAGEREDLCAPIVMALSTKLVQLVAGDP